MKINTDGVLLGALAEAPGAQDILDIGTGTGVIALMLAQRFSAAKIDAVEIDRLAAETANRNFHSSPFAARMNLFPTGFQQFFESNPDKKYELIVSNPPFYINSLKSPGAGKQLAKHADRAFFQRLVSMAADHLSAEGLLCLILPIDTAQLVCSIALRVNLYQQNSIRIHSFKDSEPHRSVMYFGFKQTAAIADRLVIYESAGIYSEEYIKLLQPYFVVF